MRQVSKGGWFNSYRIANSGSCITGRMVCHKCKKPIKGDYLIKDRQNFNHRGNETDQVFLYHRECSPVKKTWQDYDSYLMRVEKEEKIKKARIKEVKKLIEKYGLDAEDLFDLDYLAY